MTFKTSEDIPFERRGGDDSQTALYNRIAAINRINYLVRQQIPGFDIREKSKEYTMCMDLELWVKFYQHEPRDKKIDEEFCQRTARVCLDMEKGGSVELKKEDLSQALQQYGQDIVIEYLPSKLTVNELKKKENIFQRIIRNLWK